MTLINTLFPPGLVCGEVEASHGVTGTAVFLATKISTYKFGKVTNDHCSTGNNNTGIYKVLNQTQITIL